MLALDPGLMASMDDAHFLSSLDCESPTMRTPVELELMARLEAIVDIETGAEVEARLEKSYESALEQSEFRAQCIGEILELCDREEGAESDCRLTPDEIIERIRAIVENSYVEI